MFRKIRKILFVLFSCAAAMAVGVVAIAQTKWFKKQLETGLHDLAEKNGVFLSIGSIEGSLPLQWKLTQVLVQKKGDFSFSVEEAKVRLSFLPLLQRKLAISYLKTEGAELVIENKQEWQPDASLFHSFSSFPFDLSLRSLHIDRFSIKGPSGDSIAEFAAQGAFLLKKSADRIDINIQYRDLQNGNRFDITVAGGRSKRHLSIHADTHFDRLATVLPCEQMLFLEDAPLTFICDVEGPWATWEKIFGKTIEAPLPLRGSLHSTFSPWKLEADFLIHGNRSFEIDHSSLHSELGQLQLRGKFAPDFTPSEGILALKIPKLEAFHADAKGEVSLRATLAADRMQGEFEVQKLFAGPLRIGSLIGSLSLDRNDGNWQGILDGTAASGQATALIHSTFSFDPSARQLELQEIDLEAPAFSAGGHIAFAFAPFTMAGDLRLQALDLATLHPFIPSWQLAGQCGGSLHFGEGKQLTVNLLASELQFRNVHIGCCDFHGELIDKKDGKIAIEAQRVYFPQAYFSSFRLNTASDGLGWPIAVEAEGTWKYPFRLAACARYRKTGEGQTLAFEKLDALFLEQPLHLERPARLDWHDKSFHLQELAMIIGEGRLESNLQMNDEQLTLSLRGEKIPMSWAAMLTPYLSLEGESSLNCQFTATKESVQGFCRFDLSRIQAMKRGEANPFYAKGSLEAHLSSETLQINSILEASESQMMQLHLSLPMTTSASPFSMHFEKSKPISGSFEIEGKLEEIYSFANTGSQSLTGWASGKMLLFGTLNKPQLQGTLALDQASYANHFIGFELKGVSAALRAEKEKIIIDELIATDGKQGTLQMQGDLLLDADQHFPFSFTGMFEHFNAIDLDLVHAKLTGAAALEGNFQKARLEGSFSVDAAEVGIPKSMPADLPDLPYTFSSDSPKEQNNLHPRGFPLAIDIAFDSADTITFQGNGLTSTWGGKVHLHGFNLNLLASGALRLSKGQFQILGKTFLLQQGELTFSDKPGQEGFLNLTGTLTLQDATITAQLRGPLSSPQLSFYAAPALTTNEIFSLLLFNKRVSEIKPVQAVQLAHTVLTFYGHTGWNPVSQIGTGLNALGIDTFDIIPSEEGLKQSSITIGKHFYLVRNMLITLTQSRNSRRFLVEVDIGRGFLFQAENQSGPDQSQQEGKFSLKWNKNY